MFNFSVGVQGSFLQELEVFIPLRFLRLLLR